MGDVLMQDGPKPLDRIEMWAIGRQLDQMDTTSWPCKKSPDIGPFVVGGVVPDDMNDALVGVARFDLGQKLRGTDPINRMRRPRLSITHKFCFFRMCWPFRSLRRGL